MEMNTDDDCQPFQDSLFDMTDSGKCNLKLETGMEMNADDDYQPLPAIPGSIVWHDYLLN